MQHTAPNVAAEHLAARLTDLTAAARDSIARAASYQPRYANQSRRAVDFRVGARVLLSTKNVRLVGSAKFSQRFIGPFTVLARVSNVAYRLALTGRVRSLHPVFHVSQLRPSSELDLGMYLHLYSWKVKKNSRLRGSSHTK